MAYVRGDKAQFDAWEELGNHGWNWETLLPYFKKVEKMFAPKTWQRRLGAVVEAEHHGFNGDMHVGFSMTRQNVSFYRSLQKSWHHLGAVFNEDVNSGATRGFDVCPQTMDPQLDRRWDAATAFLWPVEGRQNVHLINGTVTRVTWRTDEKRVGDGHRAHASGVEYLTPDNKMRTVTASREVILSAGTFRTPLILERSGIGNPRLLREMGVEPIIDLPGVGENLLDQPNTPIMFHVNDGLHGGSPFVSFATAAELFGSNVSHIASQTRHNLRHWAEQIAKSNPAGPSRAKAFEHIFRIQHDLIFNKNVTISEIFTTAFAGTVVSTPATLLPFSRGSIHKLASHSTAILDLPAIDPKYFAVDLDMTTQIAAGRLAAVLAATPPLSQLATSGLLPPDDDSQPPPSIHANDAEWKQWTADAVSSNWHSMGTAAMMSRDLGGVVDAHLSVYETQGLRVVDASILPMPFSGHPMAILYAVAERAAEMIRLSSLHMLQDPLGRDQEMIM